MQIYIVLFYHVCNFLLYSKVDIVDWQSHFTVDNLEQLHLVLEEVRHSVLSLNCMSTGNHPRSCLVFKDLLLFYLKSTSRWRILWDAWMTLERYIIYNIYQTNICGFHKYIFLLSYFTNSCQTLLEFKYYIPENLYV